MSSMYQGENPLRCSSLIAMLEMCTESVNCTFEQSQRSRPLALGPGPRKSGFVVEVNGACSTAGLHLAQSEPFLADWGESYASSTSTEESEAVAPFQEIDYALTSHALSPSKPWESSDAFVLSTAQNNMTGWHPQKPLLNPRSFTNADTLGPQLILRPVKAFFPKGMRWGQFSLISKYMMNSIRRYPQMMLSNSSTPPFIHQVCLGN